MYKIYIKGEAHTQYDNINDLNGIDCQDNFADYFGRRYKNEENEQSLIDKEVRNGYMHFEVIDNKLWTVTTYECNERLTDEELDILSEYTRGQWSDGIGEGFEQEPCYYDDDGDEVYISPCSDLQFVVTEQVEVEGTLEPLVKVKDNLPDIFSEEKVKKLDELLKRTDELLKNLKEYNKNAGS